MGKAKDRKSRANSAGAICGCGEEVPPVASPKIFNPYTEFPVIIMRAKWKHSGVLRSSIEGDPYDKDC